jgi:Protein of unknown function (DUF4435)
MTPKDFADRIKGDLFFRNKDVAVLTEDFEDQWFWGDVFRKTCPALKLDFPNSSQRGEAGRSVILKYKPFIDNKLVLCHDSDNENLWSTRPSESTPFTYQTYVYSIENYCFQPIAVQGVFRDITLIDDFDFETFLKKYSEAISDLFHLWFYARKEKLEDIINHLKEENLRNLLSLKTEDFDDFEDVEYLIREMTLRIPEQLVRIKDEIGGEWYDAIFQNELPELKKVLKHDFDIEEEDILFFIKGHLIFDGVILPFLEKVVQFLKEKKLATLKQELVNVPDKVREERLNHYRNISGKDLKTKLLENYRYCLTNDCKFFREIIADIKRDFPN